MTLQICILSILFICPLIQNEDNIWPEVAGNTDLNEYDRKLLLTMAGTLYKIEKVTQKMIFEGNAEIEVIRAILNLNFV